MLFDYLIIVIFLVVYKLYGVYIAIGCTMGLYLVLYAYKLFRNIPIEKLQWVMFVMIELLGALTLLFHNVIFFKFKPTVLYWIFGLSFNISPYVKNKVPILEYLLGDKISLSRQVWHNVNLSWAIFFYLLGIVNLVVAFNFSLDTWIWYKTLGSFALSLIFFIPQVFYMAYKAEQFEKNNQSTITNNDE